MEEDARLESGMISRGGRSRRLYERRKGSQNGERQRGGAKGSSAAKCGKKGGPGGDCQLELEVYVNIPGIRNGG